MNISVPLKFDRKCCMRRLVLRTKESLISCTKSLYSIVLVKIDDITSMTNKEKMKLSLQIVVAIKS